MLVSGFYVVLFNSFDVEEDFWGYLKLLWMFIIFLVVLINGYVKIKVYDEVYVWVNFGFVGFNLDFFVVRVCFKGGVEYSINIF